MVLLGQGCKDVQVHLEYQFLQLQVAYLVQLQQFLLVQIFIGLAYPDDPEPQIDQQLITQAVPLQPELIRNIHILQPLPHYLLLCHTARVHKFASALVCGLVEQPEGDAIVLVVEVGEPIPSEQETIAPAPVAVEDLLPRLVVALG